MRRWAADRRVGGINSVLQPQVRHPFNKTESKSSNAPPISYPGWIAIAIIGRSITAGQPPRFVGQGFSSPFTINTLAQ